MQSFPAGLCILSPRPILADSSGSSLGNIIVDDLPDGALCLVPTEGLYKLDKTSSDAVSSPDVIATGRGASAPGRWVLILANGADSLVLVSESVETTIPQIGPGVVINHEIDITGLGFEVGESLSVNPLGGLSTAIIAGECFVETAIAARWKIYNKSAGPAGPFTPTVLLTQIRLA